MSELFINFVYHVKGAGADEVWMCASLSGVCVQFFLSMYDDVFAVVSLACVLLMTLGGIKENVIYLVCTLQSLGAVCMLDIGLEFHNLYIFYIVGYRNVRRHWGQNIYKILRYGP